MTLVELASGRIRPWRPLTLGSATWRGFRWLAAVALLVAGAWHDPARAMEAGPGPASRQTAQAAAEGAGGYRLVTFTYVDGTRWRLWGRPETQVRDVAADRDGNAYLVGGTTAADFPVTEGAYDTSRDGGGRSRGQFGDWDVFVMKLDPQGRIVWSTFLGGPNYDRAYALEVGADGHVYVGGRAGEGFPTTEGVAQPDFAGDTNRAHVGYGTQDGFVAKLTPDGRRLVWATYVGAGGSGFIRDIDVDAEGQVHVAMSTVSRPMAHITADAAQPELRGAADAVYAKLSADGRRVLYATYYGGGGDGRGDGVNPSVRVNDRGEAYFVAFTSSDDVATTEEAFQRRRGGEADLMLAKFASDGKLLFSTYIGGSDSEVMETHGLALDSRGNPIVAGATLSRDFPVTAGALKTDRHGDEPRAGNGFIAKLSPDGSRVLAATYLGGTGGAGIEGIAVTADDEVVVTGGTRSADFPLTPGAFQRELAGDADVFVAKLDASLSRLLFSTYLGGGERDEGRSAAVSRSGHILVGGRVHSDDFPVAGAFDERLDGSAGGIYLRLAPQP